MHSSCIRVPSIPHHWQGISNYWNKLIGVTINWPSAALNHPIAFLPLESTFPWTLFITTLETKRNVATLSDLSFAIKHKQYTSKILKDIWSHTRNRKQHLKKTEHSMKKSLWKVELRQRFVRVSHSNIDLSIIAF